MLPSILVIVAFAVILAVLLFSQRRLLAELRDERRRASEEILAQVENERLRHENAFNLNKQEVDHAVEGLEKQLARYEALIRDFEKDRSVKYGSLEQQLAHAASETQQLQRTTERLSAMLGNARVRGQWGERTAEDILKLCGLKEQVHYLKQEHLDVGRPDFTFVLPDEHRLYMDVKFPLDNFVRYVNADSEEEQLRHRDQFLKDVKVHLKDLERRDYASAKIGPDYIIMFIPNERVYAQLNEWMPGIVDETLGKRIIVCGPATLYAYVRLIVQAWDSFYHTQAINEITKTIRDFQAAYERFKKRFQDLGEKLEGARAKYDDIVNKSYAQLDRKIKKIEAYKKGVAEPEASESGLLLSDEGADDAEAEAFSEAEGWPARAPEA